jgi:hypothetical protein
MGEERRDVLEDDAGLRVVRDVAHVLPKEFPCHEEIVPAAAVTIGASAAVTIGASAAVTIGAGVVRRA